MRVVAYMRVSTDDQGRSGLGLEAQAHAIAETVERKGWTLVETYQDVASGKAAGATRPGLAAALAHLEDRSAGDLRPRALLVAKLDRLSRSLVDFAGIAEQARREGWQLVVLDMDFDMTTPIGEAMAGMLAVFAQFERRMIAERTRLAMQAAKRKGRPMGRKKGSLEVSPEAVALIRAERAKGATLRGIAAALTLAEIPTARGGQWSPETVRQVLAA